MLCLDHLSVSTPFFTCKGNLGDPVMTNLFSYIVCVACVIKYEQIRSISCVLLYMLSETVFIVGRGDEDNNLC